MVKHRMKRIFIYSTVMLLALLLIPAGINSAYGAVMRDYCVKPPLIGSAIPPNLLMILDNSASMYDLLYQDTGEFGACSVSGAFCTKKEDCPQWNDADVKETCGTLIERIPTYCYDQTYSSKNTYEGYFEITDQSTDPPTPIYYEYDWTTERFKQISALPASGTCVDSTSPGKSWYVAKTLCLAGSSALKTITTFAASGNYLNWLTMSKFDIQKKVLTGGKYFAKVCSGDKAKGCVANADCVSPQTCGLASPTTASYMLVGESRGCVGRKYLKEALKADFVQYDNDVNNDGVIDAIVSGNTNTSLGITFGINGPVDAYNQTAPSSGGTTVIEIYLGDYNEQECQEAIAALQTGNLGTIKSKVDECLSYSATESTCAQDASVTCNNNNDCVSATGTCSGTTGTCYNRTTTGTCNDNNGTCGASKVCIGGTNDNAACNNNNDCPGGSCSKKCVGGGRAGLACTNDGQCAAKSCSTDSYRPGVTCTVASDCYDKNCASDGTGISCSSETDCNDMTCDGTSPAVKVGDSCTSNDDCRDFGPCGAGAATLEAKTAVVFSQTMQACWAYNNYVKSTGGQDIGTDEVNTVQNKCSDIYKVNDICLGGANDGLTCSPLAPNCPDGACVNGPSAIRPGNPSYLCGANYTGFCADTSDDWANTSWSAEGYATASDCIEQKHREFCNSMEAPPVTDPSDAPSVTTTYDNLPAIIGDVGVGAQLGQPVKKMKVLVQQPTSAEPTNLLQQFSGDIRMGVMTFNLNGTLSECKECTIASPCTANDIPCPKKCSTSPDPDNPVMCGTSLDCPSPETATCASLPGTPSTPNQDGAKILHYIGSGYCYTPTATACVVDANCGAGQKCINKKCNGKSSPEKTCVKAKNCAGANDSCVSDGSGSHASGLVRTVDDIRATSWTPFAEAYYNAIGYLAKDYSADATGQTSRSALRINTTDFDATKNPSELECQRNTILFITDGMSTADLNSDVTGLVGTYFSPSTTITTGGPSPAPYTGACSQFAGSQNLDDLAYLAKNYDINTFNTLVKSPTPTQPLKRHQQIQTFVAFNGVVSGESTTSDCNNKTILEKTATNGGSVLQEARNYSGLHEAINNFFQSVAADTVSGTAASVLASGEGSGANLVQAVFYPSKTFEQGSEVAWLGRLSNMWYYVDPSLGNSSIREDDGLKSGATSSVPGDKILDLRTGASSGDYVTQLYFDALTKSAKAHRWEDDTGDGLADAALSPDIRVDDVSSLWEAGKQLWSVPSGTAGNQRNILTYNVSGTATADNMLAVKVVNRAVLRPYLNKPADWLAAPLILWVRGHDTPKWGTVISNFRKRQAIIGGAQNSWKLGDVLNSTPKISTWQPMNVYHTYYGDDTYGPTAGLFESSVVSDSSYLTTHGYKGRGNVYAGANDGMLHAFRLGKLKLNWTDQDKTYEKARLANGTCSTNSHIYCYSNGDCPAGDSCTLDSAILGEEAWAYIPKNVLPYLQYMADPTYCHVYSVDLTPVIYDVSITKPSTCGDTDYSTCPKSASTWKTVLIGGMRLGGGCRKPGTCSTTTSTLCTSGTSTTNTGCPAGETCVGTETCNGGTIDCVHTPILDPSNANKGLGYSSYFALDITNADTTLNQNKPKLLWEFDGTVLDGGVYKNYLGYATSGPAVVRINSKTAANEVDVGGKNLNGKWFVVFGSGPTGAIDQVNYSFLGRSDQNLRLFVFDLANGPGADNANVKVIDTLIPTAFAGNLTTGTFDVDRNYADEVVYVPYTYPSDGEFTNGGIGRLLTRESTNLADWEWSVVMDNIGPISTGAAKLKHTSDSGKRVVWLYFGAGRFFYHIGSNADDANPANRRQLFGVKDPCVNTDDGATGFLATCPAKTTFCDSPVSSSTCGGLTNVDDVTVAESIVVSSSTYTGWYVNMEPEAEYPLPATIDTKLYNGERTITDPAATQGGIVYFTSFRPYKDACEMGGITHLWAFLYDTGGSPVQFLKGKAIIQVSTGSIEQIDLATAFTERGNRRTPGITGVPPTAQGVSVMAAPGAAKRPVHIRER